jgi:pimeloyl-ACP methyl ester carboxylesterase
MTDGLLLVHAFPVDAQMWSAQRFGARTIAPNLPGFGGADPAPGGVMTMASAARRCLDALDDAGLDRAVVCGLSMGGYVAFEFWRTAPERVAGLILANTRAGADTPEGADGRRALAARLATDGNVLVANPPPLLSQDAPEELWDRVRAMIADQPAASIAAAALGMAERPDSTADLPGIGVPTLVITSDGDTLIAPELTTPIADHVPAATLTVIRGAGHLSNLERPDAFNEAVLGLCARCGVEP